MASVNKVTLIGNLGRDPETRYMPEGGAVTNITAVMEETIAAAGLTPQDIDWFVPHQANQRILLGVALVLVGVVGIIKKETP